MRTMCRWLPMGVLVCTAVLAGSAAAQTAVVNGEFNADPTIGGNGWTQGGAFGSSQNVADGSPAAPSVQLATSSQAVDDQLLQCVDLTTVALSGVTVFDFGARIKNIQFVGTATMTVDFFPNANCTGGTTGSSTTNASAGATNGFTEFTRSGAARPGGTSGARITLNLHDGSSNPDNGAIARFDHVFFGPAGTVPVTLTKFDAR